MLKQRVITAVLLAVLALGAVFFLPLAGVALFLALITLLASWEWGRLSGLQTLMQQCLYMGTVALALLGCWVLLQLSLSLWILLPALLAWLVAFVWVYRYPCTGLWARVPVRLALGVLFLVAAWLSLLELKRLPRGDAWFFLVLLTVWAADVGAYFSGKRWGCTKLAPAVSPGKTREGVYGGLVSVMLVAVLFALAGEFSLTSLVYLTLLCVVVALASVMGDLFESLLKRHMSMKDSGSLLPGHGGVLDRIDSLLVATPFFYFGLNFLPIL